MLSHQWVPRALSPWVMQPGHEADHSPQTNAKVMKIWIYIYISPLCLNDVVLNQLSIGTSLPLNMVTNPKFVDLHLSVEAFCTVESQNFRSVGVIPSGIKLRFKGLQEHETIIITCLFD
jgi:hypothetical protein